MLQGQHASWCTRSGSLNGYVVAGQFAIAVHTIVTCKIQLRSFCLASWLTNSSRFSFMQHVAGTTTELVVPPTKLFAKAGMSLEENCRCNWRVPKCVPSAHHRREMALYVTWSIFISSYRSFYFVYESEVTFRDIKLYRFTGPDELYLSGDLYPPNKGFCVPKCLPTGLLNISRCQPLSKWSWPFRFDFRVQ